MKPKPAKPVKKPTAKKRKAAQSPVTDVTDVTDVTLADTPKSKSLPPEESLHDYKLGRVEFPPPHTPLNPFIYLPRVEHPKLTAVELAALVGALGLPATRDGASAALRCVWECALVLKEQADWFKKQDANHAHNTEIDKNRLKLLGFDPHKQNYPMEHTKFIALLNRTTPRDGIKINGKVLKGIDLFHEFWKTDPRILAPIPTNTTKWHNRGAIESIAILFIYWRDEQAKRNKDRTKRNLKKGEVKKKPRNG